ncbi:enoyl-CoA hydratase/isomerase family protein [Natrinema halophilum]|uniref:Enoyl-CoA hydratase/isomerase family protein n=1 Tax=Natrinema halophilum TaxID=1699371 RepID=A0A7D5L3I8_9EURY|nr:enoyl-CoA hydratase/isomerase family protein [Natrinema halophilum]QLG50205.1 enoyl-CoA hydratase/isomerase family protein [Natrinema halophilum]
MTRESFQDIEWSVDEETGIGRVVIDRPESLNALTWRTRREIAEAFERFQRLDDESHEVVVKAVVLEGKGDNFSAGADTNEFGGESAHSMVPVRMYDAIERYGAPVIAKVSGYCLGGGLELALACDFVLAAEESEFGFPEIEHGLCPGAGGTVRLVKKIGADRTKQLGMTGERLSGREAADEGIIYEAYPAAEFDAEVREFIAELASKAPLGVRGVKHTANFAKDADIDEGTKYEWSQFYALMATRDYAEAAAARREDRNPEWKGR